MLYFDDVTSLCVVGINYKPNPIYCQQVLLWDYNISCFYLVVGDDNMFPPSADFRIIS